MIVVLYQQGCSRVARSIASDLWAAFVESVSVLLVNADSPSKWPEDPSWDDLLVVVYRNSETFSDSGNGFIGEYVKRRNGQAALLPVSLSPETQRPPAPAAAIKAFQFNTAASGPSGRLVNRIGGMLSLRWQGRDSKIFISYRALDGAEIATQLQEHLASLGHSAFLDQAKEGDHETMILPGRPVQEEIDHALENANMVLLIDTPSAPDSTWIGHEVNTAGSLLLPVLPICFREPADRKRGPRFPSLVALQRWVEMPLPARGSRPLSREQLEAIVEEAEQYLCEVFRRKCRVPYLVEREFVSRGFAWNVLNKRLLMFQSTKNVPRIATNVISHCSVFDPNYGPAMKSFIHFLKQAIRCNFSLFIYDGNLLPASQLETIADMHEEPVVILHHQELATLIDSNFTTLATA
ncbi:toll/interleukin-1 receptor domain-containing protein [Bradyrhizobium xenonodulans]|uniref:Toll/interleukin-1 receptor domain-containing protein n=1 Tax=Bradyrhizobium xenonodulans TaxID=2736875 RepID=A0ABY7MID0_9BRAD|nr:toll/interleukin-1 receptor domain-containing protein [Bradyrhizobium xenonodulans]WBL78142.1 toll/interleukin-1 receptor domain-containing protein [Bradyrhizobium xenonodulans]